MGLLPLQLNEELTAAIAKASSDIDVSATKLEVCMGPGPVFVEKKLGSLSFG